MSNDSRSSGFWYFIAAIGALLIVGYTIVQVKQRNAPQPLDQARADERAAALAEIRSREQVELTTYGWLDRDRGIVRLPIDRAREVALSEWQDPEAARAKLLEMNQKATNALPKPPEEPSPFE